MIKLKLLKKIGLIVLATAPFLLKDCRAMIYSNFLCPSSMLMPNNYVPSTPSDLAGNGVFSILSNCGYLVLKDNKIAFSDLPHESRWVFINDIPGVLIKSESQEYYFNGITNEQSCEHFRLSKKSNWKKYPGARWRIIRNEDTFSFKCLESFEKRTRQFLSTGENKTLELVENASQNFPGASFRILHAPVISQNNPFYRKWEKISQRHFYTNLMEKLEAGNFLIKFYTKETIYFLIDPKKCCTDQFQYLLDNDTKLVLYKQEKSTANFPRLFGDYLRDGIIESIEILKLEGDTIDTAGVMHHSFFDSLPKIDPSRFSNFFHPTAVEPKQTKAERNQAAIPN